MVDVAGPAEQAPDVFFAEWRRRRAGARRDVERAAALLAESGLPTPDTPVLGVVGSKGKGTAPPTPRRHWRRPAPAS